MSEFALPKTIIGGVIIRDRRAFNDANAELIAHLINYRFRRVADRELGWTTLYKDPIDGGYWELSFPKSYLQGGGPQRLDLLTESEVRDRYGRLPDQQQIAS